MTAGLGFASVGGATVAAAQVGEFPSYHWCPGQDWHPEWGDNWDGTPATTTTIATATATTATTTSGASQMVGFRLAGLGEAMAMASLWFADRIDQPLPPNPVDVDRSADVAVVGAGLTGLIRTSAARAGDA